MKELLSFFNHFKIQNTVSCVVTLLAAEGIYTTNFDAIEKIVLENENLKPSEIVKKIKEESKKHAQQ